MQRCDFASIIDIVRRNLANGAFDNQMKFVSALFSSYMEESEEVISFDLGQVNRWLNGLLKLNTVIIKFYISSESNQLKLAIAIENAILPRLSDSAMVVQQVCELLVQDATISEAKKQELIARREESDARFLARVLVFGMSRPFIKRDVRRLENNQICMESPLLQDYIFGAEVPAPCRTFCGRDAELETLHTMLNEKGKVFLQGIPGIGKSEIAKAYAHNNGKAYKNILYFIYSGDLMRDIANLQFVDDMETEDDERRFQRHHRFLQTLKDDTLLIIDNFNTTVEQEKLVFVVMKYRCRILFTTKSHFVDFPCMTVEEISDHTVLWGLFSQLFKKADKHHDTVEAIMEVLHYHTLSIELAARLAQSGLLTPEQILSKLREEKAAFNSADEIKIVKDGRMDRATYFQHICKLFSLFQLNPEQGYAMQCMSMMPLSGVPARLFAKWSGFTDMNTVNELEELGFLRVDDNRKISLHPMMQEVTVADLAPSVNNCRFMLKSIGNYCRLYGRELPYVLLIKQIVENTIQMMKKDDPNFYIGFLQQVYVSAFDPCRKKDLYLFIDEIERLLKDETVGTKRDRAFLLEYQADMEDTAEKIIVKLKQALEMYPEPAEENALELCNLHAKIADWYRRLMKRNQALCHMKKAIEIANQFPEKHKDIRALVVGYASLLNDIGKPAEALQTLTPLEQDLRRIMPDTYEHAMVLRKLGGITASCGDIDRGLSLLDEAWGIYRLLCGDDVEKLQHYAKHLTAIRREIIYMRDHPGRVIAGL